MPVNSRFKAIQIIGQRKAVLQAESESNCTRKEAVDIDILVTSMNGDRRKRGREASKEERQASEGPTVLHIRFCSLSNNYKQQLRALAQTPDNSNPCMAVQQIYRDTEQPQEKETS